MANEEKSTTKEELTLSDVMKEIRALKKAGWVTPAAFGGSIALLGISLQIPEAALSKCVTAWFLIAVGLGFMAWCMYQQSRIKV